MISILKIVFNRYINGYSESHNNTEFQAPDNEEDLLAKINQVKQTSGEEMAGHQMYNIEDEKGCFYKTGFITEVRNDHVMIDDNYFCETKNIVPTDLKERDKVYYLAYRKQKDDDLKIRKILEIIEPTWDDEEMLRNNIQRNSNQSDQNTLKKDISTKVVIGKVTSRKGREVFVKNETDSEIRVDLDNIKSEFVPFVGDWVKLQCLCEINENISNVHAEILEVEELKPLRSQQKHGKVTEYNEEFGIIDENIIFAKSTCSSGYVPRAGDQVFVHCIESDQRDGQSWRALRVFSLECVSRNYETSTLRLKPQMSTDLDELVRDKGNIEITNNIKVHLDVESVKIIKITVKNIGNYKQTLLKCSFSSKKFESQLTLLNPVENVPQKTQEPHYLKSSESATYRIECRGCFVGVSEELIIFSFRGFKIGRLIVITVDNVKSEESASAKTSLTHANNCNYQSVKSCDDGLYIKGVRPYTPARFISKRPMTWTIPDVLWKILEEKSQGNKWDSAVTMALLSKVHCLRDSLTVDNYKERFEHLLYLEEIAQIFNMRQFDMNSNAVMQRSGEFLTLNVPGLAEKRPSLIIGDRVLVSFNNNDETCGQKCYEGFIHKIKSTNVFLKFHKSFHENYNGQDCQIKFKGSKTVIQRCHTAISMAMDKLGRDFLFPERVFQKEPQYNFIEVEDDVEYAEDCASNVENSDDRKIEIIQQINNDPSLNSKERFNAVSNILNNKKLVWFNKRLNIYQKEAVKNILKGVARPLPYVIFGPPGTGKTITVCEAILQILFTMNDSRILVCTPSNSSANLIVERLLEIKKLPPGELVRLVAHHYLENYPIPDTLIPYCATADIAEEGTRADVNLRDARGYRKNVTLSVLCRSRVIVGTCTAIGILHNMGCKPGHFTHVVIDEAGQATEPQIMIPLTLTHGSSSQIILAGDPKQLGPVNQSVYANYHGLNDSFLVRLLSKHFPYLRDPVGFGTGYDPRLITKLLMNYRSLPDLLDLANKLFYENELEPQIDEHDSEEADLLLQLQDMLPRRLGDPLPIVFHAVDGKNMQDPDSPSWYNIEEVDKVCYYLQQLYDHDLSHHDIGIITPYSKQVYKIKNMITECDMEMPKVGSVEEFQGQERKVIILSIVRTAADTLKNDNRHALGFFHTPERVNVAITRARSLLIIIGNPNLLEKDHSWRSVLDYCKKRNAYRSDQ